MSASVLIHQASQEMPQLLNAGVQVSDCRAEGQGSCSFVAMQILRRFCHRNFTAPVGWASSICGGPLFLARQASQDRLGKAVMQKLLGLEELVVSIEI